MTELTKEDLLRQDEVDNAIHNLLRYLSMGKVDVKWDIDDIGTVREAVKKVIVGKLHVMTEMEFYPYVESSV